MDEAERELMGSSKLYQNGDTILVWVNEGDLYRLGNELPRPDEANLRTAG
jgi:hypothetical protein